MQGTLNQTWDLDVFFPGGSESPALASYLAELEGDIAAFSRDVAGAQVPATLAEAKAWSGLLESMQSIARRMRHASAFASCLSAQNMKDEKAKLHSGRLKQINAAFSAATTHLDSQILQIAQPVWEDLLATEQWAPVAFVLNERRRRASDRMGADAESLVGDLSVDGYHAWGDLYNTVVGRIGIPVEENGKVVKLSAGQAFNKLSAADRTVRSRVFEAWEKTWGDEAELIGAALNHLGGYRVNLYKHRGWDSILKEPLENNRMTEATLNVMWDVIEQNKDHLVAYLQRKAKLLGLPALGWHDVDAPLSSVTRKVSYEEAAAFVVDNYRKFSPQMADFAQRAIESRWVEAEDRPGKRPGGFCTSFPLAHQSRIFMTFGGSTGNISTLAHELGHAYHQHVMNDLPQLAQGYAMNVAETASTFGEMIVADAALRHAETREERLAMLADKIERSVAMFMNIHARFLFETSFYAERSRGLVPVQRLNELMETAQRKAYRGALGQYHPHFWASKLHFYSTGQPFYNFPYTFGYLFSTGVYARALSEGPGFAAKYVDLLRDTGRMRVEDLAMTHLGVDLTKPGFWQSAVDLAVADIQAFLKETE